MKKNTITEYLAFQHKEGSGKGNNIIKINGVEYELNIILNGYEKNGIIIDEEILEIMDGKEGICFIIEKNEIGEGVKYRIKYVLGDYFIENEELIKDLEKILKENQNTPNQVEA